MHSPLTFDRPLVLLLLPPLLLFFWAAGRGSYAGLHPAAARLALLTRTAVAALLLLALAGAHLVKRSDKLTTVFLLDVSRSIRPDQRARALAYIRRAIETKPGDDAAGVVVFGRTAFLEDPPSENRLAPDPLRSAVAGSATNLSEALHVAQAAFPPGTGRKIVLLSDGNENLGQAENDIESLRAQGVRIDVAPTAMDQTAAVSPEAMVDSVITPARAHQSAPFGVRVVVSSTVSQAATLTLQRDRQTLIREKVRLKAGKNAFSFQEKVARTGFHRYDALLEPTADAVPENNHAYGYVSVLGRPRILYVTDPGQGVPSLKRAMDAQEIALDVQAPGAVPASVAALASYDSILLADVPADELGGAQMAAIEEAVKDFGVGLGMIGGEHSFAAGRYTGTPVESALPVRMDIRKQRRLPQAAIVIVLDASGSMAATEDGVEKVQLGARAAVQLMTALQSQDQVAVTAVTETTTVVVPLEDARKSLSARAAIEGVHAGGGGIYCFQGLEDAYALLMRSHAPIKHVIICADTGDSEQQEGCLDLAHSMAQREHITTTVCGIGHAGDQHVPFQRALAHAGRGQLFVVSQASDLPRLFERDVQAIQQSLFVEKPILPRPNPAETVIAGIPFNTEPPLLGYNLATPKPGATVALSAPDTPDPIFSYWRYGLGRTFAWTSDDRAHWAVQWLPWDGYTRFWAQVLRWSLRSNSSADFQTAVDNEEGHGHLVVDAFNTAGGFLDKAAMTARVVAPDLSARTVLLTQTAPGRYEGVFDTDQTGAYMVNVRSGAGRPGGPPPPAQTLGLVVPYSPEYRTLGPNLPLLTRLAEATGGRVQSDPGRIFRDAQAWVVGVVDLAPALLVLSALLFLGDIAIRRLAVRPQQVRETAARGVQTAVRGLETAGVRWDPLRGTRAPSPVPSAPQVDRLMERKLAARAVLPEDEDTAADRLLARRAGGNAAGADDPFPFVASLPRPPKSPPPGRDKEE